MKEVGDHLGTCQSPDTTRIYAKVDLAALRAVGDFSLEGLLMNINDLVTHYVAFRRTLGEQCIITEKTLRSFCRAVGPRTPVTRIRLKAVAEFLAGTGPITRTWHFKHSALKGLFQFAVSRGHLNQAPLPTEVPKCPPTLVPYIYSREEFAACWTRSRHRADAPAFESNPTLYERCCCCCTGLGCGAGKR